MSLDLSNFFWFFDYLRQIWSSRKEVWTFCWRLLSVRWLSQLLALSMGEPWVYLGKSLDLCVKWCLSQSPCIESITGHPYPKKTTDSTRHMGLWALPFPRWEANTILLSFYHSFCLSVLDRAELPDLTGLKICPWLDIGNETFLLFLLHCHGVTVCSVKPSARPQKGQELCGTAWPLFQCLS